MTIIANPLVQNIRRTHPLIWIIVTNLIPAIGVYYADWNAYEIIMMYWFETMIMGFIGLLTILSSNSEPNYFIRIGLAIFFCIHFGGFCAIQGVLINIVLKDDHKHTTDGLTYAVIVLAGNYLLYFLNNQIFSGKYKTDESYSLFGVYGRVAIQLLAILIGGYFIFSNNNDYNKGLLLLMISLKILADLGVYLLNRDSKEERAWKKRHNIQETDG
jgi:intracellular septation protein A